MGYYSDVRISTDKTGYDKFIERCRPEVKYLFGRTTNEPEFVDEDGDSVVFGWNSVKWYDWFGDVKSVMKALRTLGDEGYSFEYLRVGEDPEDIERMTYGPDEVERSLYVRTEIVY